jgi:hypothetical protein
VEPGPGRPGLLSSGSHPEIMTSALRALPAASCQQVLHLRRSTAYQALPAHKKALLYILGIFFWAPGWGSVARGGYAKTGQRITRAAFYAQGLICRCLNARLLCCDWGARNLLRRKAGGNLERRGQMPDRRSDAHVWMSAVPPPPPFVEPPNNTRPAQCPRPRLRSTCPRGAQLWSKLCVCVCVCGHRSRGVQPSSGIFACGIHRELQASRPRRAWGHAGAGARGVSYTIYTTCRSGPAPAHHPAVSRGLPRVRVVVRAGHPGKARE